MTIYLYGFTGTPKETAIRINREYPDFVLFRPEDIDDVSGEDVLIRYGKIEHPEIDDAFGLVLNKSKAIKRNRNKAKSTRIIGEHGICVPVIIRQKSKVETFPVLGRRFWHARGSDIIMINCQEELEADMESEYWTPLIPSRMEFRVHVAGDEAIRISKKLRRTPDGHPFLRNHDRGWRFSDRFNIPRDIPELMNLLWAVGTLSVKYVGLDWGAVDVLIGKETPPKFYVLEVNSGPKLNREGRMIWQRAMRNLMRKTKQSTE